jgi:hypothetical protein
MKCNWILSALALALCAPTVRADDQADLKALLTRAIAAHGGADNLNKYIAGTMRGTGKVNVMNQTFDFNLNLSVQEPDKVRSEVQVEVMGMKFNILTVMNGDNGWMVVNGKDMEVAKEQKEQTRESLINSRINRLTPLLDKDFKLSPLGEIKVDGKPALGIRAECKDFPGANLYFDKQSGLLVKSEMQMSDPGNPSQQINGETYYSDYRKIEGMMVAYKIVIKNNDKTITEIEITEATVAAKLDDNLFAKP